MTEIVLIRHGETAWNAERRLQGHLDIPLNETGLKQAEAMATVLAVEQIDAIYASDLQRALQTADALARRTGKEIQVRPALRERCYGGFEGLLYAEIEARYPELWSAMQSRDPDVRFPDGVNRAETLHEFHARALHALHDIALPGKYRKIAIVSHGGVLDCLYRAASGMPITQARDFDVLNASINRGLLADGKLEITHWGDVAHLTADALDELEN